MTFNGVDTVLEDHTGGIIAAKKALLGLAKIAHRNGVELREHTRAISIKPTPEMIQITTNKEIFTCKQLIITAGPWINKLVPMLGGVLTPVRQTVAYFKSEDKCFPHWAYIDDHELFYGLPEIDLGRIKISEHRSQGKADDPTLLNSHPNLKLLEILKEFIKKQFTNPYGIIKTETCFYTSTKTEDFIVGPLSDDSRIIVGAACGGHGFKFAPLTGRILADLFLYGKTDLAEYDAYLKFGNPI